jgi:hypothetical protein
VLFGVDATFCVRHTWSRRYAQDSAYWPWDALADHLVRGDQDRGTALLQRFALIRRREAFQDALAGKAPDQPMCLARAHDGFVPLISAPRLRHEHLPDEDDPAYAADLRALLADLGRDHVQVVLFQVPTLTSLAGDPHRQNARIAALATRFKLPFLDFNGPLRSEFNRNTRLYSDPNHLGALGAARFGPALAHELARRGLG